MTRRLTIGGDGRYALNGDGVTLEVDPQAGGRVTSFRLRGAEALSGPETHPTNWGSTLWTSPQSAWGWPPPPEFDDVPYAARVEGDALVLRGPPCATLGVVLSKRFALDDAGRAVIVEYAAENVGHAPCALALWEVSRVPSGGLTFFPTGDGTHGALPLDVVGRGTWYRHRPETLTESGSKSSGDGTGGFIAHAGRGLLFVKSFDDTGPERQAPGEGEVEIYGNTLYVEVELQGPYVTLAPGVTTRWSVRWTLHPLPAGLDLTPGNDALLTLAASVGR
jgi:hypothetical protein